MRALGLQDADSAYEFSADEGSPQSPALSAHSAFSAFTGMPALRLPCSVLVAPPSGSKGSCRGWQHCGLPHQACRHSFH